MPNHLNPATADLETASEAEKGAWTNWFSTTVTSSTEQAYTGAKSLKIVRTAAGNGTWGVTFNNWPGFQATTGAKTIRLRARQGSNIASGTFKVKWRDATNADVLITDLVLSGIDGTWKLFSTTAAAPITTTAVYVEFTGPSVANGSTLYIDDIYIGDEEAGSTAKSGSDTGVGSDAVGSLVVGISASETGSGVDAGTVIVARSDSEAALGTDLAAASARTAAVTETGSGSDLLTAIGRTVAETSAGTDAATLGVVTQASDASSVADTGTTMSSVAVSDTASTADSGSITASLTSPEVGAIADSAQTSVTTTGNENAAVTDTGNVSQVGDAKAAGDLGFGTDTGSVLSSMAQSESGTGIDAAILSVILSRPETGLGTDNGSATESGTSKTASETGAGTDSGASVASLSVLEQAFLEDRLTVLSRGAVETASAVDAHTVLAAIQSAESALGSEVAAVVVFTQGTESILVDDLSQILAVLSGFEVAVVTDSGLVTIFGPVAHEVFPDMAVLVMVQTAVRVHGQEQTVLTPADTMSVRVQGADA